MSKASVNQVSKMFKKYDFEASNQFLFVALQIAERFIEYVSSFSNEICKQMLEMEFS